MTMMKVKRIRLWLARQRIAAINEKKVEHQEALYRLEAERQRQARLEAKWR